MENKFNGPGSVNIGKQVDNSNNKGQINMAEGNAKIIASQNIDNKTLNGIDMNKLLEELNSLKTKLVEKEMYDEASAVKGAIEAKDEKEKIGFLRKAGIKTLEIAKEISLPVATAALSKILGV